MPPTQEDHRARFFEHYGKEAEEYDEDFMKKHDEDLNTTLIFVSPAQSPGGCVLTTMTSWSVFRSHVRIHHRGPLPPPTRPKRRDR